MGEHPPQYLRTAVAIVTGVWAVDKSKSIEITTEMIDAGLREYLHAFREEDDPADVLRAISHAMCQARPEPQPQEP